MNVVNVFATPGNSPESELVPKNIDFIKEGNNSQDSLTSWGKNIENTVIKPIHDIIDTISEISEVSDRSLSPILSDLPKCKYCTCPEDKSMCICIKCNNSYKTPDISPPRETKDIDSDVSTHMSSKRQKLNFEIVPGVSNYLVYKAFQQEEKRGTKFIFGIEELEVELKKERMKIGIIKSKNISNLRIKIFDNNIFTLTGKHIEQIYDSSLTHVVLDKSYDYDDVEQVLFRWCGLKYPFPFQIVNDDWLVDFSIKKAIPDETNYLFRSEKKAHESIENTLIDIQCEYTQNENDDIYDDIDFENNEHIIRILDELAEIHEYKLVNEANDSYKARGYKTACKELSKIPNIKTVASIPTSIWPENSNMWQHIKEIVETGQCEKLEYFKSLPIIISNRLFVKIHGIGPSRARDLVNAGFRTIADLRTPKGFDALTRLERISLSCYEDLQERIPRDEVKEYIEIVEKTVKNDLNIDDIMVIGAGSYRRDAIDCGDIDVLIFVPDDYNDKNI